MVSRTMQRSLFLVSKVYSICWCQCSQIVLKTNQIWITVLTPAILQEYDWEKYLCSWFSAADNMGKTIINANDSIF